MTRFFIRRDTAANWTSANVTLSSGEQALETDTRKRKTGDGITAWITLAYDAAILVPTAIKTAAYTAVVNDLVLMNVPGGAAALTLPTAPVDKSKIGWRAIGATSAVPLVITAGTGDVIGTGAATTMSNLLADETSILQYVSSSKQWLVVSNYKTLASLTPAALGALSATDPSVTNSRTPTLHASTHATAGADVLTPAAIGAAVSVHSHTLSWALELMGYGSLRAVTVGDVPEGLRIPSARTLTGVFHRYGTADAGSIGYMETYLNGTLIAGTQLSITAPGLTVASGTLNIALAAGDIITHKITGVGTTPGLRMSSQVVGTQLCT